MSRTSKEDLYMQFYDISFMHPYKQSGRLQDVSEYHKTACTSLPEDEHLDVRNNSKSLQLN